MDWQTLRDDTYRYVGAVPLGDGDDALGVNWCELTTTTPDGQVVYHNAFATSHAVEDANVVEVVAAGRSRWKIENENTLKTKGYHFEHNYGHGQQSLSSLLATLILQLERAARFHAEQLLAPFSQTQDRLGLRQNENC